jgi:hypothetical protein
LTFCFKIIINFTETFTSFDNSIFSKQNNSENDYLQIFKKNFFSLKKTSLLRKKILIDYLFKNSFSKLIIESQKLYKTIMLKKYDVYFFTIQESLIYIIRSLILVDSLIIKKLLTDNTFEKKKFDNYSKNGGLNILISFLKWQKELIDILNEKKCYDIDFMKILKIYLNFKF